jgi:hypothetical protein
MPNHFYNGHANIAGIGVLQIIVAEAAKNLRRYVAAKRE